MGLWFLILSFNGKEDDTMTTLRHTKFIEKSTSTSFDPASLPPTKVAAFYLAFRVQLQVAQWISFDLKCMNRNKWGRAIHDLHGMTVSLGQLKQQLMKTVTVWETESFTYRLKSIKVAF